MFTKRFVSFTRNLGPLKMRLKHHIALGEGSYLRNTGCEPLINATLGDQLAKAAHKNPGRVAIRSVHEDVIITYEELLSKADSFGCMLRENGFENGDKLGLWSHNCSEWIIALVGATRAGIIPVLLNPMYEKRELNYCINKTKLKGIFTGESFRTKNYNSMLYDMIPELNTSKRGALTTKEFPTLTTVITAEKKMLNGIYDMNSLIRGQITHNAISKYGQQVKQDDGCLVLLTSGSTGNPKAALNSHKATVNNSHFIGIRNDFTIGHQIVCIQAPLFHALGSIVTMLSALQHGMTVVLASPVYSPTATIKALCAEKCTVVTGTPTMYVDILSIIKDQAYLPINLNMVLAAGAPCSPELIRRINSQLKVKSVRALYGLTETTACVFQSIPSDNVDLVAETVGYLTDHTEVKVVNSDGNIVPFGSPGELMVRGYGTMICYLDDPDKTKEAVREDGWLYTGDRFIITPEGYGKVVGRIKEIIVRGGENIAPKEIEDFLNMHPDVIESQVIGVSHERLGEEVCAVVRIRENAKFTLEDLKKHCAGNIASFKIPKILKITHDFPKTTSGKIQKYKVKELVESGKI